MILIVTHKTDFTADFIIDKLNKNNKAYYRFNCDTILEKNIASIRFKDEAIANINGISEFHSVWFRRTMVPELDELDESVKHYIYEELDAFLSYLWRSIRAERWLSHPENIYRAENKVYQLNAAKKVGLTIPKTIISGDPKEIRSFYHEQEGNVIIKPLFYNRFIQQENQSLIFTNKLSYQDLIDIEKRPPLPSIFQQNVKKSLELRITVVGNQVFTASVESQNHNQTKTDWRRKKLKFKRFELDNFIQEKCKKLVHSLNLNFGAIDMILTPDGQYIFLEINPNGQWVWIEQDTGLNISEAIINYLS